MSTHTRVMMNVIGKSSLHSSTTASRISSILLSSNYVCIISLKRLFSSTASSANEICEEDDDKEPKGNLFNSSVGKDMLGKYASIRRVFGPRSNSQAMLTHGGAILARHSSFDPTYSRAKLWIRHHPVGPALISPVLINGIIGALVEASMPHSVPISTYMKQIRPLIVGVEMEAKIKVQSVIPTTSCALPSYQVEDSQSPSKDGFEISLLALATRVRDDATIAEGEHKIWVADYMNV